MPSGTKTFLGSLEYSLDTLPSFYVAEIETKTSEGEICFSNKLRSKAVREYLQSLTITHPRAINYNAKKNELFQNPNATDKGPVNHLIILCDEKREIPSETKQALLPGSKLRLVETKYSRRDAYDEIEDLDLTCRVSSSPRMMTYSQLTTDRERDIYFRCLGLFISTLMNDAEGLDNVTNPANKVWFPKSKIISSVLQNTVELGEAALKHIAKHCAVALRAEPVLNLKDYPSSLRLDFDLVLQIKDKTRILDFLLEFLGNKVLDSHLDGRIPLLKSVLIGLEVIKEYQYESRSKNIISSLPRFTPMRSPPPSPSKDSPLRPDRPRTPLSPVPSNLYQATIRPDLPQTPTRSSERKISSGSYRSPVASGSDQTQGSSGSFRIQDIRLPGEVPRFTVTVDDDEKDYTVVEYLKTIKRVKLLYPHLPLVRISNHSWIPLECLRVAGSQLLRNTEHLSSFMQLYADEYMEDEASARDELEKIGAQYIQQVTTKIQDTPAKSVSLFGKETPQYVRREASGRRTEQNDSLRNRQTAIRNSKSAKLLDASGVSVAANVFYFPSPKSDVNGSGSEEYILKVCEGLKSGSDRDLFTLSDVESCIIRVDRLLSLDSQSPKINWADKDLLIGIIDEKSRSRSVLDQIRAEFYKFAHLTIGIVAVAVSKQNLDDYQLKRKSQDAFDTDDKVFFPERLMQRIHYMLGYTNYAPIAGEDEKRIEDPSIMIMGAHISHPSSTAGANCPSVASLVCANEQWSHYHGSARVQETNKKSSGVKHITQSQIVDIETMVAEHLNARTELELVSRIIFFRDSISPSSPEAEAEFSAIQRVCKTIRDGIKLVYVVVKPNDKKSGVLAYNEFFADKEVATPKYLYTIAHSDPGTDMTGLKEIVLHINKNNHLGPVQVSMALPVHFAQKLCKRFFNYFHFYAKDSASIAPSTLQYTHPSPENPWRSRDSDIDMVEMVNASLNLLTMDDISNNDDLESETYDRDENNGSLPWKKTLNKTMFYL